MVSSPEVCGPTNIEKVLNTVVTQQNTMEKIKAGVSDRVNTVELDGKVINLRQLVARAYQKLKAEKRPLPRVQVSQRQNDQWIEVELFNLDPSNPKDELMDLVMTYFPGRGLVEGRSIPASKIDPKLTQFALETYGAEASRTLMNSKFIGFEGVREDSDIPNSDLGGFVVDPKDFNHFEIDLPKSESARGSEQRGAIEDFSGILLEMTREVYGTELPIFIKNRPKHANPRVEAYRDILRKWTFAEELGHAIDPGVLRGQLGYREVQKLEAAYGSKEKMDAVSIEELKHSKHWNVLRSVFKEPWLNALKEGVPEYKDLDLDKFTEKIVQEDWPSTPYSYFLRETEIRGKWFAAQYLKKNYNLSLDDLVRANLDEDYNESGRLFNEESGETKERFKERIQKSGSNIQDVQAARDASVVPRMIYLYYQELYQSLTPPVWMNPYWKRISDGKPLDGGRKVQTNH